MAYAAHARQGLPWSGQIKLGQAESGRAGVRQVGPGCVGLRPGRACSRLKTINLSDPNFLISGRGRTHMHRANDWGGGVYDLIRWLEAKVARGTSRFEVHV
jgi:hypothetical protein